MIPSVAADVLPYGVEEGTLRARIPNQAFGRSREISSSEDMKEVLREVSSQLWVDQRNAIDDGKLALAVRIGALKDSFDDVRIGAMFHMGES